MERRLLTNFHIGTVEGIISDVLSTTKSTKDVFSQIAKVIGRNTSNKKKKKDWNTLVRSSTVKLDPIGSSKEAMMRQNRRQSLRQHIISNVDTSTVDQDKLLGKFKLN